jgi:hypothetical protein
MHEVVAMSSLEDVDDPKHPRPALPHKKGEGWMERGESRKDEDRDEHDHVHVRC